jgi:AraC-like DNA-binding protein
LANGHDVLRDDQWRDALASNFNGLIPDAPVADASGAEGWLSSARLSDVAAFHVAGTSQVLRRSPAWARRLPTDLLKVCIQRTGSATIRQDDREVMVTPGSMAIYDIDRPYSIRLDGEWRCSVIAFPRAALMASEHFIDTVICRQTPVADGPGSVLIPLVASAVSRANDGIGAGVSDALMGRACVDLLKAALAETDLPRRPDAVRLQIDAYIRAHIADARLNHATVAAAHHMSERTLHRMFDDSGQTVTEMIRSYRLNGILADLQSPALATDAIARIAAHWGIHDMPHLIRAFRARYGITPSEARLRGRANKPDLASGTNADHGG